MEVQLIASFDMDEFENLLNEAIENIEFDGKDIMDVKFYPVSTVEGTEWSALIMWEYP